MNRPAQAQVEIDQDAQRHAQTVNLVMWFFQALDSAKYIQDPQLRSKVYNEVTEAFRLARNARPMMPFPTGFGGEEGEGVRRV